MVLLVVVGCGGPSHVPLEVGARWEYAVSEALGSRIEQVSVVGHVSDAGGRAFRLVGDSGESYLRWRGGWLEAGKLAGTRYAPPLPLAHESGESRTLRWEGRVLTPRGWRGAAAEIEQKQGKTMLGADEVAALHTSVEIRVDGETIRLDSWFQRGTGLIRQRQRRGDRVERSLVYLSGP